jgi:hypothetical protein
MTVAFDPALAARATAELPRQLPALEWITDSHVERPSQDFYGFSPILKRQLDGLRVDAVASAGSR